jgi:Transglycosylase SLT domain
VGPTTPFGAINSFTLISKTTLQSEEITKKSPIQIRFLPKRQVLHGKSDLVVEIHDREKIPALTSVKVFFNSVDVTDTFLSNVDVKNRIKEQILEIEFKDVRLKLLDDNQIKIGYQKEDSLYVSQFNSPTCDFFDTKPINNIQGFSPPNEYILWMNDIARKHKFNPNLLTGIVAQESSFDPKAISWAKAIGLTQMTSLAEEQIRVEDKQWPQTREISSLNYVQLKQKISTGELNEENEWRLHPHKSLQGGAEYIAYLHKYWTLEENQLWLKKLPGDPNIVLSQVILASYNSGPSRVKSAIISDNEQWIKKPELKEAFKYINKVFSYCYHFSERSVSDDG